MKGLRFRHPLAVQFKPAISEKRTLEILPAVERGDTDAINEMIEGHVQYACAIVGRYLMSMHSNVAADDLTEAAFYGLVDGVNAIHRNGLDHANPTGYIARFIHGEIRKSLKLKKSIIYTPRDEPTVPVGSFKLEDHDRGGNRDATSDEPWTEPDNSLEVEEDINALISDSVDERIVRLLQLGYLPIDIARELGLHRSNISRRISRIQDAYKELNK